MSLTAVERETAITLNDEDDTAHVWTAQRTIITKLKKEPVRAPSRRRPSRWNAVGELRASRSPRLVPLEEARGFRRAARRRRPQAGKGPFARPLEPEMAAGLEDATHNPDFRPLPPTGPGDQDDAHGDPEQRARMTRRCHVDTDRRSA